jgi:hypothetical protein
MRAFTERVNATLPVDAPDAVLLAMVQSHAPGACSAACPQGEDRAANGRCVPSALVAGATVKGGGKAAKASADAAPPTAHRPADGRMSLAGPPVASKAKANRPQAGQRRRAKIAGWSRSLQGRPRDRRPQRPPSDGYSGMPKWALPFLMPF